MPPTDPNAPLPSVAKNARGVLQYLKVWLLFWHPILYPLQCFRWRDRFHIVAEAEQLEEVGLCLSEWSLYHSGIVFAENNTDAMTLYTIRMNPDMVDGGSLRDGVWRKQPRNGFPRDVKYTTFGFSFMQVHLVRFDHCTTHCRMQDVVNRHTVDMLNDYEEFNENTMGVWLQMYPTVCANVDQ